MVGQKISRFSTKNLDTERKPFYFVNTYNHNFLNIQSKRNSLKHFNKKIKCLCLFVINYIEMQSI